MAAQFMPQPLALLGIETLSGRMRARRARRSQKQTGQQKPPKLALPKTDATRRSPLAHPPIVGNPRPVTRCLRGSDVTAGKEFAGAPRRTPALVMIPAS